jgi:chromate transport protein ChrA
MILFELFYTFLMIGAFTFGGGYSMIALIQDEVVTHHGWLTGQEFADILAISQITPGPVGINTATYAGYSAVLAEGYPEWMAVAGAVVASLAVLILPLTLILVVAAAFSLLVAGIGIMNIMLVSVTERTKEIGLRMAVGATGPIISLQFLIESVLISVTGGLLGILVGCSASTFLGSFGMPSSVPAWSIYVSFMVCVFIGVLFGYIPAQKAANMDPIEAIRHE